MRVFSFASIGSTSSARSSGLRFASSSSASSSGVRRRSSTAIKHHKELLGKDRRDLLQKVRATIQPDEDATVATTRFNFTECKNAVESASLAIGSGIFAELATAFPSFADEGGVTEAAPGVLDGQTSKSYYATLFLFVLSAPGLYSLVKRSAKSKITRKTFELPGPKAAGDAALPLDDVAREISMYFKRNNYVVADAGEVITFEGNIAPERGTAAYITFCIAIGLLCVGLVCSIALPGGNFWYSLVLISPLSGKYYLDNAGRKENVKVKMVDNEVTTDVIVEGDAEEIERFRRDLNLCEKGMVRVKGILEQ